MMNRVLVVNVNWLGDVVFSSPVFRALREAYPKAHIACMAPERVRDAVECIEGVDEFIAFDEKGGQRSIWSKLVVLKNLRSRRFDSAYFLHRSTTRALLVKWAGIPQRIGYITAKRQKHLTQNIDQLPLETTHRSDVYLGVLEGAGLDISDRQNRLRLDDNMLVATKKKLAAAGVTAERFMVVNPGGNWDLKRWPAERFSVLIDGLIAEHSIPVILTGAEKDADLCESIVSACRANAVHVLAGKTSLKELFAVLAMAELVVSNDSGPLHVANSLGTDVIALFGPTRPELTGPRGSGQKAVLHYDVGCNSQPCYFGACRDNICMKAITVKDILNASRSIRG